MSEDDSVLLSVLINRRADTTRHSTASAKKRFIRAKQKLKRNIYRCTRIWRNLQLQPPFVLY